MFDLTRQERRIIIFLLTAGLTGAGINFLSKRFAAVKRIVRLEYCFEKINLNQADKNMLLGIKGIGEKLAERIIEFRKQNHGFRAIEDLRQIKGINAFRYEKIKDSFLLP